MQHEPLFSGTLVSTSRIIYTPSSFAKSSLVYLQEVGTLTAQQPHISTRSDLKSYLFLIVIAGSGEVTYAGTVHQLAAGDCCFIDCQKEYAHSTSNDLWTIKWVHFYGEMVAPIYQKYLERGGFSVYHTSHFQDFNSILSDIYQLAASDEHIRDMLIHEKLTGLLTKLMDESWHPGNAANLQKQENIRGIKAYLDAHYGEKITLDALSEQFYINKFHMERSFKEAYGAPITAYLLNVRITKAKNRLRFTAESVDEIACVCGFSDTNYFIRQFKKIEGATPGVYRKRWNSTK